MQLWLAHIRCGTAARRGARARGRPRLEHAPNLLLCCPAPQLSLSPGAAAGARTPPVRRGQRTRPARATLMAVLALSPCLPVYLPRRHSGGSLSYRGAALAPHGHCGTCAEVAACGWPLPRGSGGATRVPEAAAPRVTVSVPGEGGGGRRVLPVRRRRSGLCDYCSWPERRGVAPPLARRWRACGHGALAPHPCCSLSDCRTASQGGGGVAVAQLVFQAEARRRRASRPPDPGPAWPTHFSTFQERQERVPVVPLKKNVPVPRNMFLYPQKRSCTISLAARWLV